MEKIIASLKEKEQEYNENLSKLTEEKKELEEKIEGLEERVDELEIAQKFQIHNEVYNDIRTVGCLEKIFDNLQYIPIDKLENFVNQYAVL